MSPLVIAGLSGAAAGAIMLFLSHIAPRFGAGNFVRDLDEPRFFGRTFSRREAHVIGVFVQMLLSFFFGVLYRFGVEQGIASGYGFWPLATYAVLLTIFIGGVVMPLEGHGLFGLKEDDWFPVDLLLTNIGWAFFYAVIVSLWISAGTV